MSGNQPSPEVVEATGGAILEAYPSAGDIAAAPVDEVARVVLTAALPLLPVLPDPKGGCVCTWHSEDRGGGAFETVAEYEPACPEHSENVYNPRTGVWDLAPTAAPTGPVSDADDTLAFLVRLHDRLVTQMAEALGLDPDRDDDCVPGCSDGPGGTEHLLWHLIQRATVTPTRDDLVRVLFAHPVSSGAATTAPGILRACESAADAVLAAWTSPVKPDRDTLARELDRHEHVGGGLCSCGTSMEHTSDGVVVNVYETRHLADVVLALLPLQPAVRDATPDYIDVLFDGPPSHESGRFVEVENPERRSVNVGEWVERDDGLWALRIPRPGRTDAQVGAQYLREAADYLDHDRGGNSAGYKLRIRAHRIERGEV